MKIRKREILRVGVVATGVVGWRRDGLAFRGEPVEARSKAASPMPSPGATGARSQWRTTDRGGADPGPREPGPQVEWHSRLGTPFVDRGQDLGRRARLLRRQRLTPQGRGANLDRDAVAVLDNLARFYGIGDGAQEASRSGGVGIATSWDSTMCASISCHRGLRVARGSGTESCHFDEGTSRRL